jgi:uncharacterized protein (DUF1697 family)
MPDLKIAFEDLGYKNVSTLLATGNVCFESADSLLKCKTDIQEKLTERFKYEAFAQILDASAISAILATCTLAESEESHLYVLFIEKPETTELLKLAATELLVTEIQFAEGVLFWKVPKGETLSMPFSKELAKPKYKNSTTMRNINTVRKLIE